MDKNKDLLGFLAAMRQRSFYIELTLRYFGYWCKGVL